MTTKNLTKLTKKYTPSEIKTAVRVLLDILATQNGSDVETIDPKEEFTGAQIKRLQKQLAEHKKGTAKYLNLNQVKDALGV
jgi:hypothetical protein